MNALQYRQLILRSIYNHTAVIKVLSLASIIDIVSAVQHQIMYAIEIQVIQCFDIPCNAYYYYYSLVLMFFSFEALA